MIFIYLVNGFYLFNLEKYLNFLKMVKFNKIN